VPAPDALVAPANAAGPTKAVGAADKVLSNSVGKMQMSSTVNGGTPTTGQAVNKLQEAVGGAPDGTNAALTARKADAQAWIEDWRSRSGAQSGLMFVATMTAMCLILGLPSHLFLCVLE
jgi:hypothetical protein